jgi:ribosomal protein S12 methylthiotransferase accessory factor
VQLQTSFLNAHLEMLDAFYDDAAAAELAAVSRGYNHQLGPIGSLLVHRPDAHDLPLFSSSCGHSPVSALMADLAVRPATGAGPTIPGGGKGATLGAAIRGALGETSERLLAVLHYQAVEPELRLATSSQLEKEQSGDVLHPERLSLFAPEQHTAGNGRWAPFTRQTPVRWMTGRSLLSGEPVHIPAQLVLLYYERVPGEPPIGYPTTGGLGFHADRRRAVLHGLYEWIERDAINVGWVCRLAPQRVDIDVASLLPGPVPYGVDVRVFLNTLDVPFPVITVTAVDRRRDDLAFLGGGGAWSNRDRALRQALYELAQCATVLKTLTSQPRRIGPSSPIEAMNDFLDATVFYGYRANARLLDWYTNGNPIAWQDVPSFQFRSLDEEWDFVLAWLRTNNLDPVVIDFDGAAWPGASAVKVVVPELTPAWVPADPYLGHPRYYELPQRLGRVARPLRFDELNRLPLPFP